MLVLTNGQWEGMSVRREVKASKMVMCLQTKLGESTRRKDRRSEGRVEVEKGKNLVRKAVKLGHLV